jgi:hypothetical protein
MIWYGTGKCGFRADIGVKLFLDQVPGRRRRVEALNPDLLGVIRRIMVHPVSGMSQCRAAGVDNGQGEDGPKYAVNAHAPVPVLSRRSAAQATCRLFRRS